MEALLIFLTSYLPGRAILHFTKLTDEEKFAASFGVSFFIFFLIQFFYLKISLIVLLPFTLILLKLRRRELVCLLIFFLAYLIILFFQTLLPIYSGGLWSFDWFEHYQRSIFFLDRLPTTTQFGQYLLTARPPLFNTVTAFFMSYLGREFYIFQTISSLLNITLLLPCFLLTKNKGSNFFLFTTLVLLLNPSFIIETTYTWSKALTTSYVLLGLHFYINKGFPLAFLFLGLAQITHYSATPYILIFFAHMIYQKNFNVKVILIFFGVISPWYIWAIANFDFWQTFFGNTTFGQNNFSLVNVFNNSIKTFLPILSPGFLKHIANENLVLRIYDSVYAIYASTIFGQVTFSACLLLLKIKIDNFFKYFCLAGLGVGVLVIPGVWPTGIAHVTMLPVTFLLISLVINYLYTNKNKIIYVLILTEAIIGIGLRLFIFPYQGKMVEEHIGNIKLKTENNLIFLYDLHLIK